MRGMSAWDERTPLPISLGSPTLYLFAKNSMFDTAQTSFLVYTKQTSITFFEMAIGDFSLNSELFLHTAKNQLFFG